MNRRWIRLFRWAALAALLITPLVFALLWLRAAARRASCLGNTNAISLSLRMYAQDWDESLPGADTWMDLAYSYCRTWTVFRCTEVSEGTGYGFCLNDAEHRLSEISDRKSYPLIFETSDLRKNAHGRYPAMLVDPPRHLEGLIWIGYAEGHPKAIVRPVETDRH